MPIHNADIAAIFEEIADLLEIDGANPFRVRAYRNGARTLEELGSDVRTLLEQGRDLTELPGIGKELAAKIEEIVATGSCAALEKLHRKLPAGLSELLKVPGLGPKRVKTLYHELNIQSLEQLLAAAQEGRIHALPGFGEKTEQHILEAIKAHAGEGKRFKLAVAKQYGEAFQAYLEQIPGVDRVVLAGSFRRAKETVGDLDILVTVGGAGNPGKGSGAVMEQVVAHDQVHEVVASGSTRATMILKTGLQVDVRVVAARSFGAALHYFTGSKAHNIAIRRLGVQRGLRINEYGVFRAAKQIGGESEESVFASVGLPYIQPELRENRGEIEAAQAGALPRLIEPADLRGDLHVHTLASDGHNSLREMALAARERGFEYIAITEHSRHLTVARGLDSRRLLAQIEEIDRLNQELAGITVLKGIEVDILENGELDLPDEVLGQLDLVIGAVHSKFHLSRDRQTERILRAMDHPFFSILAHPTGRLIQQRPPYELDLVRVIRHAKQRGCSLELNAHPDRLDLTDTSCRLAKEEGVLVSINSDSHSVRGYEVLPFGIGQARRGWLEKENVLNSRSLEELLALLKRTG